MHLLLLVIALLLVPAPGAAAQSAVDPAAEALRDDPVYVDPQAQGVLSPDEADALRRRIEEVAPGELRIAVLPPSAGDPRPVTRELRSRLGGSVGTVAGNSFAVDGTAEVEDAATAAVNANEGEGAATVLLDFVDRVGGAGTSGGTGSDDGGGVGAGGLILLGLAGAGGAAVLASRRRRRREEEAAFAEVKDNARDDLVALGEDIRALDLDIELPNVSAEARADYEQAVNAYDRADSAWETARRPEDLEPVGAALEEGRWAMASAKARLEDREPPERRTPCFFDPRHGPSSREVEWAPYGGEPRMVPACEADAQRVEHGDDPEAREVTLGGQRMPYWAAGPMYAPFMGGFFGVGLLPGLLVGTMLGSTFDTSDFGGGDFGGGDFGGGDFGGGDFGGGDF
ncbi:MAG TPA: hypothetical protein VHJ39_01820 [Solirubrobacteraceae bacterium]|jgi:hypothetical protein|nr:hypothetical protein [Solirubrobacteraceae bacterium]